MKLKKLAALTLAGAMALSLAACGGGSSSSGAASSGAASSGAASTGDASAAGEVYKIGVLAPEVTHGWSAGVAYYAEQRCQQLADEGKSCRVVVPDDQLSLAIGKEGQNARLAARLTGYKIDIKPASYTGE